MASLLEALRGWCERYGTNRTYWLACSGGLDSRVLLHLASVLSLRANYSFKVIHIHHGLNPKADAWAMQCEAWAREAQFAFHCERLHLGVMAGDSLEALARQKRYEAFTLVMQAGDVMLTGHHQDDQAETLLLQLCRGAGVKGLASMPVEKPLGQGVLVRPLLGVDRSTLSAYATMHALEYIDDDSNASVRFTRNYFRHAILPLLKARWPSVTEALARSASHCAEADGLLTSLLADKLAAVQGSAPRTLSVSALNALTPELQKALIRAWLSAEGAILPNAKKLETLLTTVLTAGWDKRACVAWGEVSVRRHRDEMYLCRNAVSIADFEALWPLSHPLSLPDGACLTATAVQGRGVKALHRRLTVRYRRGGEEIKLAGRRTHRLKALFQTWGVLPWLRDRIPLLYDGATLVGVVGYAVHADYEAQPAEMGFEVRVEKLTG